MVREFSRVNAKSASCAANRSCPCNCLARLYPSGLRRRLSPSIQQLATTKQARKEKMFCWMGTTWNSLLGFLLGSRMVYSTVYSRRGLFYYIVSISSIGRRKKEKKGGGKRIDSLEKTRKKKKKNGAVRRYTRGGSGGTFSFVSWQPNEEKERERQYTHTRVCRVTSHGAGFKLFVFLYLFLFRNFYFFWLFSVFVCSSHIWENHFPSPRSSQIYIYPVQNWIFSRASCIYTSTAAAGESFFCFVFGTCFIPLRHSVLFLFLWDSFLLLLLPLTTRIGQTTHR